MHRIQELVRLHRQGEGPRRVATLLKMSPNTERRYRAILEPLGLLEGDPNDLPGIEELKAHLFVGLGPQVGKMESSVGDWFELIESLWKRGAGPTAIHTRLQLEHPEFEASVSAVKRACLRLRRAQGPRAKDVVIPIDPVLGEAQVDFGEVPRLLDPTTGRKRRTYVFVMVLSGSGKIFARLVHDQRIESWIWLHIEAFVEFGVVPYTIVPDNLKAAVVKAVFGCSETPELNLSYRELARHYGFVIDPTPPYSPEKKGRVEAGVRYVKTSYFSTLDEDATIDDAKKGLKNWVEKYANCRTPKRTGRPVQEFFNEVEKRSMLALPDTKFEAVVWAQGLVHRDAHVNFRKRLYSVPWRFIGKTMKVRATDHTVEFYFEDARVATHPRSHSKYRVTDEQHLPDRRVEYRHRDKEYWLKKAQSLHPLARNLVESVFSSDRELSQLRQVQAMVMLLEEQTIERVESACKRALFFGVTKFVALRDMLDNGDDLQPLPLVEIESPDPDRGYRYARNVKEMLNQGLEYTNDPN